MAGDSDFYQFATRFPAAALVLLGLEPVGDYVAEAVEVKRSRRIDLLLRPREEEEPGGVRAYVELQDYADPTIERRFLEEIVLHCTKDEVYRPVEAIVV